MHRPIVLLHPTSFLRITSHLRRLQKEFSKVNALMRCSIFMQEIARSKGTLRLTLRSYSCQKKHNRICRQVGGQEDHEWFPKVSTAKIIWGGCIPLKARHKREMPSMGHETLPLANTVELESCVASIGLHSKDGWLMIWIWPIRSRNFETKFYQI